MTSVGTSRRRRWRRVDISEQAVIGEGVLAREGWEVFYLTNTLDGLYFRPWASFPYSIGTITPHLSARRGRRRMCCEIYNPIPSPLRVKGLFAVRCRRKTPDEGIVIGL